MKIVMFGDSITDMGHNGEIGSVSSYGNGYPFVVYSKICENSPLKHDIINKGVKGNTVIDLYARIKVDVWNLKPDVLSILVGINEISNELSNQNGVNVIRYERVYRMMIEETIARLPNIKIMLMEPFVLHSRIVDSLGFEEFNKVREYAQIVKKIAKEFKLIFIPLQDILDKKASQHGAEYYLYDGVHPSVAGATLIANRWLKAFKKIEV